MSPAHSRMPHHPNNDVPEEFEPGALPVEPDEGPVPALDPDDPEHDRDIDPAANRPPLKAGAASLYESWAQPLEGDRLRHKPREFAAHSEAGALSP